MAHPGIDCVVVRDWLGVKLSYRYVLVKAAKTGPQEAGVKGLTT